MFQRFRQSALHGRKISFTGRSLTASAIRHDSKIAGAAIPIPARSNTMTNPPGEILKSPNLKPSKSVTKLSTIQQLQEFQKANKHTDILNLVNSLKKNRSISSDVDIVSISVASATASKQPATVISLIDFGLSLDLKLNADLGLRYVQCCKELSVESQSGMWSKAVAILDTVLPLMNKQNQSTIEHCLEETLILCAHSGKWRNVQEIMNKTLDSGITPTERMLSSAVICCAREPNGIHLAHAMFQYMTKEGIRRSRKVYYAVLNSFVRAKLYDKYEVVWAQMVKEKVPLTDALTALRIEVYSALGEIEKAESTLQESLQFSKRPYQSYDALYLALLRAGKTENAIDLVKKMKETGVQPPEQHTASFHVQSLAKIGLVEEGLKFLREQEQDQESYSIYPDLDGDFRNVSKPSASLHTFDQEAMGYVSDAAWQSLFKSSNAKGQFNVSQELLQFAIERHSAARSSLATGAGQAPAAGPVPAPLVDTTHWISQLIRSMCKAGQWEQALIVAEKYEPLTLSNVSILLKALCQCGQEGEAVKYHQKSLDLLYAPKSFIPTSSTESWSSGSIGRVEKFLNSVTHGFVQHLASEHRVEDVIGVLDGVHASIEHFSSLHAQHTGAAVTDRKTLSTSDKLKATLPMMYTSAIRYTVNHSRALEQAQRLMDHQRKHDISPMWSCTRYAMKVMSEKAAWDALLEVFAARARTSDYIPGDEVAYTRALRGCALLGRWQDSLEILADLLSETEKPGPTVFELTLEALVEEEQWVMMTDIFIMMRDRQVTLTPRMIALCSGNFPPAVKEKMVRMIRGVPSSSSGTVGGSEETAQPSQHKATKSTSATAAGASTIPKKAKKAKKVRKAKKAPIDPSDILVPSMQEASAGQPSDTDSAQHTSQGKKRVKC